MAIALFYSGVQTSLESGCSAIAEEVPLSFLRLNDSDLEKRITGKVMASGSGSGLLGSELDFQFDVIALGVGRIRHLEK